MPNDTAEFDRTDRILLGSCAGIWLAALGAGVAATVALVDLGSGRSEPSGDSGTPWLLYTVIAISALVIIGAVPLLLRARREAAAEPQHTGTAGPTARGGAGPAACTRRRGAHREAADLRNAHRPVQQRSGLWDAVAPQPVGACRARRGRRPGVAALHAGDRGCDRRRHAAIGVGTYLMAVDSNCGRVGVLRADRACRAGYARRAGVLSA